MYPWKALLALPYARYELPGWGRLLKALGAMPAVGSTAWDGAPTRTVRGKVHGYLMRLDLSNWSERLTFFLGRYYELPVQLLLRAVLRPGDRFVDIGANIGMITLMAARCVGEAGRVDCFEPNPTCVAALRHHLALNAIEHVHVHPVALADAAGRMRLNLTSRHTGTATLAAVADVVESFEVEVGIGDELLAGSASIRAIKIDVEGFELHVLRGLERVLKQQRPMLITEFIEAQFQRAGTSGQAIEVLLRSHGYCPFVLATRRQWLRHVLALSALAPGRQIANDVLWLHRDSDVAAQWASTATTPVVRQWRPGGAR